MSRVILPNVLDPVEDRCEAGVDSLHLDGLLAAQLHSDSVRLAVLLPQKTMLKIWNIDQVTRLQR